MKVLESISVKYFNVILNDGRLRDIVFELTIDRLTNGGMYILDNAERYFVNNYKLPESIGSSYGNMDKRWSLMYNRIKDWRKLWFSDGISSTLILFRP